MSAEQVTPDPEPTAEQLVKVVTFVTRDDGDRRDLLVAQNAGSLFRVPEGLVAVGETPATAARRVLRATTGLDQVQASRQLLTGEMALPEDERLLTRAAMLRTSPSDDATLMRFQVERGMVVRVTDVAAPYVQVVYEAYELQGSEMALTMRRAGWLAASALTDRILVAVYHMQVAADQSTPTPHLPLPVYWLPLTPSLRLTADQADWLARVRAQLNHR